MGDGIQIQSLDRGFSNLQDSGGDAYAKQEKTWSRPGIALACRVAITCTLDDLGMGWMLEVLLIVARIKLGGQGPGQTINNSREGSFQYHDIH
jgi:hypothetical protein